MLQSGMDLRLLNNSYRRHNQRDYRKRREDITIPVTIKQKAIDYIRNQIVLED